MSETLDESKRNRRTAKRILAIGLPLVLIGSVGVGYAYFTTSGTGTGQATAGTPTALSLTVADGASLLSPGASTTMAVSAANNATGAVGVRVTGLTASSISADSLHPNCDGESGFGANPVITWTPPLALGYVDVPAGATAQSLGSISVKMPETGSSQDNCIGATFTVTLSAS
jgi:hypothetical protein